MEPQESPHVMGWQGSRMAKAPCDLSSSVYGPSTKPGHEPSGNGLTALSRPQGRVRTHFTFERQAAEYMALLERICARRRR
jgi:hypothetical protein